MSNEPAGQPPAEAPPTADPAAHWEAVYQRRSPDSVSWYRPHLEVSLRMIRAAGLGAEAAILDVGGGASTLVDDLLEIGYTDVTVLDISRTALSVARQRLGARAEAVQWITANITSVGLSRRRYDLWHDRAVFHFLSSAAKRRAYVESLERSLRPEGTVIIATFSEQGPRLCSGLEVVRYGAESLRAALGPAFELQEHELADHETPSGAVQQFFHARLRYLPARVGATL